MGILLGKDQSPSWEVVPVTKDDTRFPSLQQGFNRRWVGTNVKAVYLVYRSEGAARALEDAVSKYGAGTVRVVSGGHCYENFVFNPDVKAVINVTALVDSGHDESKGYYVSSGDTNWNSFKTLFRNYGRVLPGGSCYSVGLGGHISGGGEGILSRQHGVTVDWLSGVEIAVKPSANEPAHLKYVSRDSSHPDDVDLFWAHTGGGPGNFGVITKYYFSDLPVAPMGIVASNVTFDWDDLTEKILGKLLEWYFNLGETAPWTTVGKFPIFHQAAGQFVLYLYTSYQNDAERVAAKEYHYELEQQLNAIMPVREPTRALGSHGGWAPFPLRPRKMHLSKTTYLQDDTMDYPMYALTQTINGSGPNQRGKYKSAYMKKTFPAHQIRAIYKHLTTIPSGLTSADMKDSLLQVDIFGGKINTVDPAYTAIAQRRYIVKLQYQTYWAYENDDKHHLQWIRDFYTDMYQLYGGVPDPDTQEPTGKGVFEGCYFNYPDVDLNDWKDGRYGALYLYFLGNLERLIHVKKRWDPNNYFTSDQSIPPTTLAESKVAS